MQSQFIHTIIILGSLQGFLLALVLATNKKFRKKSTLFLALLIYTISQINLFNALEANIWGLNSDLVFYLPANWFFLIPFSLLFFIRYLLNPRYQFRKYEYLYLLPFIIHFIFRSVVFFLILNDSPMVDRQYWIISNCRNAFEIIAMVLTLAALVWGVWRLNTYQKHLVDTYSDIESQSLNWVKYTLIASLALWGLWAFPIILDISERIYYHPLFLGQSLIMYWLGYVVLSKPDLFEISEILNDEEEQYGEENPNGISQKAEEHYQNLLAMIEEEKLYKNPDLSLTLLAGKMKLSNGYLSQIINQKEGKNFFEFINTYRVEEFKRNLHDPDYDHFSILGIALEAGFKSKSTFNAVFKKMTGYTPTAYKKLTQQESDRSE